MTQLPKLDCGHYKTLSEVLPDHRAICLTCNEIQRITDSQPISDQVGSSSWREPIPHHVLTN